MWPVWQKQNSLPLCLHIDIIKSLAFSLPELWYANPYLFLSGLQIAKLPIYDLRQLFCSCLPKALTVVLNLLSPYWIRSQSPCSQRLQHLSALLNTSFQLTKLWQSRCCVEKCPGWTALWRSLRTIADRLSDCAPCFRGEFMLVRGRFLHVEGGFINDG